MVKEYTHQEILNMVPNDWSQVTLDTYINKLLQTRFKETTDPIEILEEAIDVASVFIGLSPEIVRKFPIDTIKEIAKKLEFLNEKPQRLKKTKYNWIKKMNDPSFDTYITYIKISEQLNKGDWSNFPLIVKEICLDKLTDEEILNLPMDEVETGFFLLRKSLMKYLEPTINILTLNETKRRIGIKMKRKLKRPTLFKKTLKNGKSNTKKNMDGI